MKNIQLIILNIHGLKYLFTIIVLLEGYVVAKFIAEESILVNDHLFLLAPQYNYEQQYQIKSVKDNKEVGKINLSNTNGYDEGGSNFKIIQNNLNDVEILHIFGVILFAVEHVLMNMYFGMEQNFIIHHLIKKLICHTGGNLMILKQKFFITMISFSTMEIKNIL